VLFIIFAMFNAGSSVLQWVYPNELFPSEVQATGIGFATAMSRIGAAGGTFALPVMLSAWELGPAMIVFAAICGIGLLVSIPWAAGDERHVAG
jgi:putative MFS transporter